MNPVLFFSLVLAIFLAIIGVWGVINAIAEKFAPQYATAICHVYVVSLLCAAVIWGIFL